MTDLKGMMDADKDFFVHKTETPTGVATKVTHYCGGKVLDRWKGETMVTEPLKKWFQPTIFWDQEDKTPACQACGEEVPESIVMMLKLDNTSL